MPPSAYAGDPVSINGNTLNLNPKHTPTYEWKVDGGKISGSTAVAQVDTSGMAPGTYTAQGHVGEGEKPGHFADCSAPFTIMPVQPPTIRCSAEPSSVHPGEPVAITSQGMSPQNRPLAYSYSASDGSVQGNGTNATLTTGTIPETITVTCTVKDDKGQTGVATTMAAVVAPTTPAPVTPQTMKLCSIQFERDTKRPTRVDNEAKACLDEIALNLQQSSDASLALLGGGSAKDAAQRAINTKQYLVHDKGIDASRIAVYAGSAANQTVDSILVPTGATLDRGGLTSVDESVKPNGRSAAAKRTTQ
jgi:hypothetical protein